MGFTDLYCVTIWIIEAEHSLSPCLLLYGMDQFHMRRDFFKSRIDILVFEI